MAFSDNPGSIHNQVGSSLRMIEVNVEQEDVAGVVNQVRLLKAKAAPFLSTEDDLRGEYEGIDVVDPLADPETAFECEMKRLEVLLRCFAKRNVYAYLPPESKDASGLALGDDG